MTMTGFEEWLDGQEFTIEEISHIKDAIECEGNVGICNAKKRGDALLIEAGNGDWLLLATPKARGAFVSLLEERYGGELGIDGEAGFRRAMSKDD